MIYLYLIKKVTLEVDVVGLGRRM